jgi:hypothetical protein
MALPKAIEKMSSELGGLSALQREGKSAIYQGTSIGRDESIRELMTSWEYHRIANALNGCKT